MRQLLFTGVAVLAVLSGSAATAQSKRQSGVDASERATYGEIRLSSGFTDDPYTVSVTSGGSIDASDVSDGCVGMVSRAPDFQLTYEAGSLPLSFGTISDSDTTLMINGPDGRWSCDDDSGGDGDALVTYSNPGSGVYDIWVGAWGGNSDSAQLFVTELSGDGNGGSNGSGGSPDASLTATYGEVRLRSGFSPDPYRVEVYSGGSLEASQLGGSCVGRIAEAPDFQLTYDAGSLPLTFGVEADGDTTLVINGPDGRWSCDDDSGGQADPEITFRNPQSGVYDVWVGAYGGNGVSGELFVTELGR
ncbi:peptidase [Brevundimonas sp. R86498]|uniref:peptidase n=1 Tax=Brevundimonas sp. R86498 TaxID=3093845 RepID=UPI0037CA6EF2